MIAAPLVGESERHSMGIAGIIVAYRSHLSTVKLYRFEKADPERCNTLAEGKIWLAAPSRFNDLEDSGVRFLPTYISKSKYERLQKAAEALYPNEDALEDSALSVEILADLKKIIASHGPCKGRDVMTQQFSGIDAKSSIRERIANTTGICCFVASDINNPPMWAHYADNHRGFCVEYEVPDLLGTLVRSAGLAICPVTYATQLPRISVTDLLFSPEETLYRVLTTKYSHWTYENEWRIIKLGAFDMGGPRGMKIDPPKGMYPTMIYYGERAYEPDGCFDKIIEVARALDIKTKKFYITEL